MQNTRKNFKRGCPYASPAPQIYGDFALLQCGPQECQTNTATKPDFQPKIGNKMFHDIKGQLIRKGQQFQIT